MGLPVWSVTGPKAVVFSTTLTKLSLSGSTRRISSVSFPCKREEMSRVSSNVSLGVLRLSGTPSRLNLARTSRSLDVKGVFERLARGIKAVGDSVKAESGKDFQISPKFGYIHSCPTNLGTGMRASVHVDLPGWTKY